MTNPIVGALNTSKLGQMAGAAKQFKSMMAMLQNAGNPQALLSSMMQQNPQMRQVMQLVQNNGGDAKKAFYALAQQKGIDPEQILQMLQ